MSWSIITTSLFIPSCFYFVAIYNNDAFLIHIWNSNVILSVLCIIGTFLRSKKTLGIARRRWYVDTKKLKLFFFGQNILAVVFFLI